MNKIEYYEIFFRIEKEYNDAIINNCPRVAAARVRRLARLYERYHDVDYTTALDKVVETLRCDVRYLRLHE